jgi:uncharacterized protein YabN with tetrapyrrole methylase and pyrophosphatase domain
MASQLMGSLKVVGTGITVSGQMTLYTESVIKNADVVFSVVTDSAFSNLQKLNSNVVNLRKHYDKNLSRLITYNNMKQEIVNSVVSGKRVVAAFYGHPGVFVNPSHAAISELREMGHEAEMLPGISAEDCLVADLGMDPAHYGCQSYEATQFLFRKYTIDPHMMQIIWQIGVIAEFNYSKDKTDHPGMAILRDVLLEHYPEDHEVIIYEAATIPLVQPRMERLNLRDLGEALPIGISTLVVPALGLPDFDTDMMAKFDLTPELIKEKLDKDSA